MTSKTTIDLEACAAALDASDDYRVLRRFQRPERYTEENDLLKKVGAIVDVETTGLDYRTSEIIELGIVTFEYDAHAQVHRVLSAESWLQEPSEPIPEEITEITGITNEMVSGHRMPGPRIETIIDPATIIIAHHADFDRKFCEGQFPWAEAKHWACSLREIDWKGLNAPAQALEALAVHFGFFYDGHRAVSDCSALLHILAQTIEPEDEDEEPHTLLWHLLESARKPTTRVWATNSPFDKKDALKARGYRWHDGTTGRAKCWYRDVPSDELDDEQRWLQQDILIGRSGDVEQLTARERYSIQSDPSA